MKKEKLYDVYIHNGVSYLEAKFSNHIKFIANVEIIGVKSHGRHPDYIKFNCEIKNVVGYFKQEKKEIEYILKDKFKDLPNIPRTLSLDSDIIDDELYCIHHELIDVSPEELKLNIVNWDCEPIMPRYINLKKPFDWSVDDKRKHSQYPCYISAKDAFNLLCKRAKVLIKNNPHIFTHQREYASCGRYSWVACEKKVSKFRTTHVKIDEYHFSKPEHNIEGNNLKDCLKNLESYIKFGLKELTCPVLGDYIKEVKLEYGEQYKELDNGFIIIKLDELTLSALKKICGLSNHIVFKRFFGKSKLGKSLSTILNVLDEKIKSKPEFVINKIS